MDAFLDLSSVDLSAGEFATLSAWLFAAWVLTTALATPLLLGALLGGRRARAQRRIVRGVIAGAPLILTVGVLLPDPFGGRPLLLLGRSGDPETLASVEEAEKDRTASRLVVAPAPDTSGDAVTPNSVGFFEPYAAFEHGDPIALAEDAPSWGIPAPFPSIPPLERIEAPVAPLPSGELPEVPTPAASAVATTAPELEDTAPEPFDAPAADAAPTVAHTFAGTDAPPLPERREPAFTHPTALRVPAVSPTPTRTTAVAPEAAPPTRAATTIDAWPPVAPTLAASTLRIVGSILLFIWAVGAALGLIRIAASLFLTERLRRRSSAVGSTRGLPSVDPALGEIPVRIIPGLGSAAAVGAFSPEVWLPARWSARLDRPSLQTLLRHEVAHHAGRDPLWRIVSAAVRALLWPHPLIHLLRRREEHLSEWVADRHVLEHGSGPRHYAELLANLAADAAGAPVPLGAGVLGTRSPLERRIRMILSTPTDLAHHRRGGWATPVLLGACCCAALGFSIAFPLVGEACDPVDECTVQKCIDETDVNIEVDDDQWVVSGHDDEGQVRWRIQLTGLDPDDAPTIVRDGRFVHVREGKRERATIDVTDGRLIERAADPIAVAPNTIFVSDPETGRRLFTIGDGRDDRIAALEKELARREAELRRIEERLAQARAQEAGDDPHRDHEHARRLHEEELRAHEETLRAHEHSLRLQELEMRAAEERRELAERSDRLRAELADREAMLENRHHELVARLEEHLARGEMEAARRMEALIAKLGPEQEDRRRAMASALADMERALVDQRNELENRFHEQFEHARDAAQESMRAAARMSHSGEEIAALTARSLDAVQAQLAEKNHQLSMLPEALTDLRDAVRTIESQLAHVTRGLDRVAARADSGGSSGAVEEMKQLVADLENALSVERTRNADLASENARLRARIAALEGDGDR